MQFVERRCTSVALTKAQCICFCSDALWNAIVPPVVRRAQSHDSELSELIFDGIDTHRSFAMEARLIYGHARRRHLKPANYAVDALQHRRVHRVATGIILGYQATSHQILET